MTERFNKLKENSIRLETLANANIEKRNELIKEYKSLKKDIESKESEKDSLYQILEIYKQVIINLRQQTYVKISSIVNHGVKTVFNDKYEFKIDVKERGGKPTCQFLIKTKELPVFVPIDKSQSSHGDGLMEIVAFLLQVTVHTVYNAPNVIFLDESFRRLKSSRIPIVGRLLQELSETLNIQFICTTHDESLASFANNIIEL
tara:strand:- start:9344 stop:9952 length:609 start_codon:yes stop_codon:yes gene_type:complete